MAKRHPNKGKRWTEQEIDLAYQLVEVEGYSIKSVAKKLGRTPLSVATKLNKEFGLGFSDPESWDYGK